MNVFKNFYESVKRGYNQEPNLGRHCPKFCVNVNRIQL